MEWFLIIKNLVDYYLNLCPLFGVVGWVNGRGLPDFFKHIIKSMPY